MNITIDISDFKKKLETFSEKENEKFIRKTINDILFSVRNYAVKDSKGISAEFTIRDKGLVRSHIKVQKALGITGYFGSVKSTRFSGWVEQQYGKRTKREIKVHTRNARGPSGRRKLNVKYKRNYTGIRNMLNSNISNMTGSYTQMIAANLAMLRRKKESGPIKIPVQFGKRKPGIYNLFKSGKTKAMVIFEPKQPKRKAWATNIILRYLISGQAEKIVIKNIKKVLKK
jgi:hypothetical protein